MSALKQQDQKLWRTKYQGLLLSMRGVDLKGDRQGSLRGNPDISSLACYLHEVLPKEHARHYCPLIYFCLKCNYCIRLNCMDGIFKGFWKVMVTQLQVQVKHKAAQNNYNYVLVTEVGY